MNNKHITKISSELDLRPRQVEATAALLGEDATVPFIARYRKEVTGSLDEVEITSIRDRLEQLAELDKRREAIIESLTERDLLTDELAEKIEAAETMAELEDIYLPYRPKRRTRATIAREKGLEPLALLILEQGSIDPAAEAEAFIRRGKGRRHGRRGPGRRAGHHSRDRQRGPAEPRPHARALRRPAAASLRAVVKGKEEEGANYKDYFDWREPVTKAPSHRVLAMLRGENEGFLRLHIAPSETEALMLLKRIPHKGDRRRRHSRWTPPSRTATSACWGRRWRPKSAANSSAARMRRPFESLPRTCASSCWPPRWAQKSVLAIDPGFRTGCKVVCLDRQGKLIHNDTIYPHTGGARAIEAAKTLAKLVEKFATEVIAIGNGTASRETEAFVRGGKPAGRDSHRDGQRERRVDLLGLRGRPRGVPGPGRHRARGGLDRPPPDGPAGRTGENRSQVHRRRAVSA